MKSAAAGLCTTRPARHSFPTFGREALCSLAAENQIEVLACRVRFGDRILRNNTTIILDLDVQLVVQHNPFAELKDLTQAI